MNPSLFAMEIKEADEAALRRRYALLSDREIIEASGQFDADFYRRTYRDAIAAGQSPLDHFLEIGQAQGLLASANFDPIVYKIRHPERRHSNPLAECLRKGDRSEYRNISAIFRKHDIGKISTGIRYPAEMRSQWAAHARIVVENLDRSVRLPWSGGRYELRNPAPEMVLSRLTENRPFSFARLTHGLWDSLYIISQLTAQLRDDSRCDVLTDHEVKTAAIRLFARKYLNQGKDLEIENFCHEIEQDMLHNPKDAEFWTAIALRGLPTFDDGVYGLDQGDVKARLDLIGQFLKPTDVLYDATLWKRWALSGALAKFSEAARNHPVVLVGPGKFQTLGEKWGLSSYRHIAIAPRLSQLIRHRILDRTLNELHAAAAETSGPKPIVLFQCGALAYWLICRLRTRHPDAFYLDLGQALDLWYWNPAAPWMSIYGDTLCAANPFAIRAGPSDSSIGIATSSDEAAAAAAEIADILKRDYLDTGLMAPPPFHLVGNLEAEFRQQATKGWSAKLPDELKLLTDDNDKPGQSPLILLEDGKPLGQGHDTHASIRNMGGGRYSFWQDTLYFSTSDDSDPTRNGRRYSIGRIDLAEDGVSPHDIVATPLNGSAEIRPKGPSVEVQDEAIAEAAAPLLVLKNEFRREGDRGWIVKLPEELEKLTDHQGAPRGSPLRLFEDGRALGPGHSSHETIRSAGGGSYSFWRDSLYFSASDNSDPNRNGRTYSIVSPVQAVEEAVPQSTVSTIPELKTLFRSATQTLIERYEGLLGLGKGQTSPFTDLRRKFIIGFTARVGSTLLCQNLIRHNVAVAEYLNPTHIRAETYVKGATNYRALASRLVETYATNGTWGVKAHIDSVIPLFLIGEFPSCLHDWRFVYLTRDNVVRQAISQIIARKTLSWASWQPAARPIGMDEYSRDEIVQSMDRTADAQRLWETFFTMFGIQPLRLTYEIIVADPTGAADRVAGYCGLAPGGDGLVEAFRTPPLSIQSTELNRAWEARFREESEKMGR